MKHDIPDSLTAHERRILDRIGKCNIGRQLVITHFVLVSGLIWSIAIMAVGSLVMSRTLVIAGVATSIVVVIVSVARYKILQLYKLIVSISQSPVRGELADE